MTEAIDRLKAGLHELDGIGTPTELELPDEGKKQREAYQVLQSLFASAGIEPLSIPVTLDHKVVLERLQAGRKPFRGIPKNRDKGYRDALLWESLLSLSSDDEKTIALVAADSSDFAEAGGNQLHHELHEEAALCHLTVVLYRSVSKFIAAAVKPLLHVSEQAKALLSGAPHADELRVWLESNLVDAAYGYEIASEAEWDGMSVTEMGISGVGTILDIEIIDVSQIDGGKVVAEIQCKTEALVDFFVEQSEAFVRGDLTHLMPWSDYVFHGEVDETVVLSLQVGISLNEDDLAFESLSISEVQLESDVPY